MMERSFANSTVSQSAARHVLAKLVALHVPVSTEYLQGNVILSVPSTFARTLHVECDQVMQALADGTPVGGSAT
ncbi:hypothetical protein [Pseudomonas sp.]|uniref:hypothetical protein n=1 Tax=Pseudomonas sp. TaxID=306 RepID=UPI003FD86380